MRDTDEFGHDLSVAAEVFDGGVDRGGEVGADLAGIREGERPSRTWA